MEVLANREEAKVFSMTTARMEKIEREIAAVLSTEWNPATGWDPEEKGAGKKEVEAEAATVLAEVEEGEDAEEVRAAAGRSMRTGKKAVLAMEEAVTMKKDGDGFTGVEGKVERERREESGGDGGRGGGTREGAVVALSNKAERRMVVAEGYGEGQKGGKEEGDEEESGGKTGSRHRKGGTGDNGVDGWQW